MIILIAIIGEMIARRYSWLIKSLSFFVIAILVGRKVYSSSSEERLFKHLEAYTEEEWKRGK
jgi:hypothetical protein